MKKILALLLAGCMALALCACGTPAEPADETGSGGDANASANGDTVVIGVFEPLSGDNGAGGKQEVLGMQYANAETPTVDIGGKTYNVKLEVVDNESSNDKAVSAASNLILAVLERARIQVHFSWTSPRCRTASRNAFQAC